LVCAIGQAHPSRSAADERGGLMEHSEIRYVESCGLQIAYRVVGEGPPDILFVPGFFSNVELMPEVPWLSHDLARLAAMGRVVYLDKRGVGLSDRSLGTGIPEDRMDDLRAVMDAEDVAQATVIGLSEGGPLALLFAAAYPERVRSFVLWGTWARVYTAPDYPDGLDRAVVRQLIESVESSWGTGRATRYFVDLPDDPVTERMSARYERMSLTPRGAAEILERNIEIDVRAVLETVHVPTLVVHRGGDPLARPQFGQYLTNHIVNARYVELPGAWHVSGYVGGDDDLFDVIAEFIVGGPVSSDADVERVLSTVLFTDIVDSTAHAATMGDRRWRAVLEQHDAIARREVERHRGVVVKQTGDGLLATFDGPGRAVRAALGIRDAVKPLGIQVRAGIHTGEIERRADDVAGIAVHIGARIGALASPDEILVSGTVNDLVFGSGLEFEDRGVAALKGVPGEWRIFATLG
jgi:class 3 adenylate cyclase/pimeloyl-ACP methyl ester carboxylesterase